MWNVNVELVDTAQTHTQQWRKKPNPAGDTERWATATARQPWCCAHSLKRNIKLIYMFHFKIYAKRLLNWKCKKRTKSPSHCCWYYKMFVYRFFGKYNKFHNYKLVQAEGSGARLAQWNQQLLYSQSWMCCPLRSLPAIRYRYRFDCFSANILRIVVAWPLPRALSHFEFAFALTSNPIQAWKSLYSIHYRYKTKVLHVIAFISYL